MQMTIPFRGLLALVTILLTLQTQAQQQPPAHPKAPIRKTTINRINNYQYLDMDVDSTMNPPQTVITYRTDSLYYMVLSGERLTTLVIDGRPLPADSFFVYDGLVRRMLEQLKRDREQAERDRQQAGRDREQAEKDRAQAGRDMEQAERDREQAGRDREQAQRDRDQAGKDALQDKRQAELDAQQALKDKKQSERDAQQALRDKQQAERDQEQAVRDKQQAERDREQAVLDKKQAEEDKKMVKELLAAVVKEGLAADEKSVRSVILDEYVLVVNGHKQSEELLKKFKEKFVKSPGYRIHYHNGSMSVGRMDP
jgi:hypothetical protein